MTPLQQKEHEQFLLDVAAMRRYQVAYINSLKYGGCKQDRDRAAFYAKKVDAHLKRVKEEKVQQTLF